MTLTEARHESDGGRRLTLQERSHSVLVALNRLKQNLHQNDSSQENNAQSLEPVREEARRPSLKGRGNVRVGLSASASSLTSIAASSPPSESRKVGTPQMESRKAAYGNTASSPQLETRKTVSAQLNNRMISNPNTWSSPATSSTAIPSRLPQPALLQGRSQENSSGGTTGTGRSGLSRRTRDDPYMGIAEELKMLRKRNSVLEKEKEETDRERENMKKTIDTLRKDYADTNAVIAGRVDTQNDVIEKLESQNKESMRQIAMLKNREEKLADEKARSDRLIKSKKKEGDALNKKLKQLEDEVLLIKDSRRRLGTLRKSVLKSDDEQDNSRKPSRSSVKQVTIPGQNASAASQSIPRTESKTLEDGQRSSTVLPDKQSDINQGHIDQLMSVLAEHNEQLSMVNLVLQQTDRTTWSSPRKTKLGDSDLDVQSQTSRNGIIDDLYTNWNGGAQDDNVDSLCEREGSIEGENAVANGSVASLPTHERVEESAPGHPVSEHSSPQNVYRENEPTQKAQPLTKTKGTTGEVAKVPKMNLRSKNKIARSLSARQPLKYTEQSDELKEEVPPERPRVKRVRGVGGLLRPTRASESRQDAVRAQLKSRQAPPPENEEENNWERGKLLPKSGLRIRPNVITPVRGATHNTNADSAAGNPTQNQRARSKEKNDPLQAINPPWAHNPSQHTMHVPSATTTKNIPETVQKLGSPQSFSRPIPTISPPASVGPSHIGSPVAIRGELSWNTPRRSDDASPSDLSRIISDQEKPADRLDPKRNTSSPQLSTRSDPPITGCVTIDSIPEPSHDTHTSPVPLFPLGSSTLLPTTPSQSDTGRDRKSPHSLERSRSQRDGYSPQDSKGRDAIYFNHSRNPSQGIQSPRSCGEGIKSLPSSSHEPSTRHNSPQDLSRVPREIFRNHTHDQTPLFREISSSYPNPQEQITGNHDPGNMVPNTSREHSSGIREPTNDFSPREHSSGFRETDPNIHNYDHSTREPPREHSSGISDPGHSISNYPSTSYRESLRHHPEITISHRDTRHPPDYAPISREPSEGYHLTGSNAKNDIERTLSGQNGRDPYNSSSYPNEDNYNVPYHNEDNRNNGAYLNEDNHYNTTYHNEDNHNNTTYHNEDNHNNTTYHNEDNRNNTTYHNEDDHNNTTYHNGAYHNEDDHNNTTYHNGSHYRLHDCDIPTLIDSDHVDSSFPSPNNIRSKTSSYYDVNEQFDDKGLEIGDIGLKTISPQPSNWVTFSTKLTPRYEENILSPSCPRHTETSSKRGERNASFQSGLRGPSRDNTLSPQLSTQTIQSILLDDLQRYHLQTPEAYRSFRRSSSPLAVTSHTSLGNIPPSRSSGQISKPPLIPVNASNVHQFPGFTEPMSLPDSPVQFNPVRKISPNRISPPSPDAVARIPRQCAEELQPLEGPQNSPRRVMLSSSRNGDLYRLTPPVPTTSLGPTPGVSASMASLPTQPHTLLSGINAQSHVTLPVTEPRHIVSHSQSQVTLPVSVPLDTLNAPLTYRSTTSRPTSMIPTGSQTHRSSLYTQQSYTTALPPQPICAPSIGVLPLAQPTSARVAPPAPIHTAVERIGGKLRARSPIRPLVVADGPPMPQTMPVPVPMQTTGLKALVSPRIAMRNLPTSKQMFNWSPPPI